MIHREEWRGSTPSSKLRMAKEQILLKTSELIETIALSRIGPRLDHGMQLNKS